MEEKKWKAKRRRGDAKQKKKKNKSEVSGHFFSATTNGEGKKIKVFCFNFCLFFVLLIYFIKTNRKSVGKKKGNNFFPYNIFGGKTDS